MINMNKVLRYGFIWGIVAVLLALLNIFLRPIVGPIFAALDQVGLSLPWFGVMMAGVHYGARSGIKGWLTSLLGGALSGLIAAVLLVIVTTFFAGPFNMSASLITLATAFVIGLFGGFGGEVIDRGW
jgi:hypothetical protein